MKIPNSDRAWIPREKLVGYLLSTSHPVGSAKAGFFRSFGFDEQNVELLEIGLLRIAHISDVDVAIDSPYGTKYELTGDLETPSGRTATIRTVWIVEIDEQDPRFVTAFPE